MSGSGINFFIYSSGWMEIFRLGHMVSWTEARMQDAIWFNSRNFHFITAAITYAPRTAHERDFIYG